MKGKMGYVVRESAGQTADTCWVDEVGQVKFKLTLNVRAGWGFFFSLPVIFQMLTAQAWNFDSSTGVG